MAENTYKRKGFGLNGILSLFRRDSSFGSQIRRLKEEIGRNASEAELLSQEAERLKKEAGIRAYDLWKADVLKMDSLELYFEDIKNREQDVAMQNQLVDALKNRIEQLQDKSLSCGERTALLELGVTDTLPVIVQGISCDLSMEKYPFVCPVCKARFEYPANFCRLCGAGMRCLELEANTAGYETDGEADKPVLETERLLLRIMTSEDFDALCVILRDPEVMYAYEHAFDEEEVRTWLSRQQERYRNDGFGLWAVVQKETGTMIGQCGITMQEANEKQVMEVGYLFAKAFWHRGYAAEAAIACRDYAFETLNAEEVYSIIREGNHASERVAEKNEMKRCGQVVKNYYNMDMPHNFYRITRAQWDMLSNIKSCAYQMGVIDCFNEMVHAGLKRIAMSHPCKTKEERDSYLEFCDRVCGQYGTGWYGEDEPFLTDLFPEMLNKDTYNIIFYRLKEDLDAYLALKERKSKLVAEGRYEGNERYRIAFEFGKLLSYTEEAIYRKICETTKAN